MLCLTTLFVSCDQGSTVENTTTCETTQETTEEITTEAVIEDVEVDYSSVIADWKTHLTLNKPEQAPTLNYDYSGKFLYNTYETDNSRINVYNHGDLVLVKRSTYEYGYNFELNIDQEMVEYSYTIYNTATGEEVYYATVESYVVTDYASYVYDFEFFGGIFEVTVGKLETVFDEFGTPSKEYAYSYSYYNHDGDPIVSNLSEEIHSTASTDNGDTLFYLSNKCYLLRNEEIFYVFDKGQERTLPYVDFEYLGFKYVVENDTYRVFDEEYNLLTTYTVPSVNNLVTSTILSNGNLFFQIITMLPEDAVDFTFEAYGDKVAVKSILVDVKTGKVTEPELDFVVDSIVTNAKNNGTNIAVNNGNQFAEVYMIADGKLATDCSFLILDNNMAKVAELPRIRKNQTVGTSFLTSGKLLITTAIYENVYYTVDFSKEEVALFVNIESGEYEDMNFGFVYGNKVYSDNDLIGVMIFGSNILAPDYISHTIYGGDSILFFQGTSTNGYEDYRCSVAYIDANGNLSSSNPISSNPNDSIIYSDEINCFFVRHIDAFGTEWLSVYNAKGEAIIASGSLSVVNYSEHGVTFRKSEHDSFNGSYYSSYYFFKY